MQHPKTGLIEGVFRSEPRFCCGIYLAVVWVDSGKKVLTSLVFWIIHPVENVPALLRSQYYICSQVPIECIHPSGSHCQMEPLLAFPQGRFCLLVFGDVLYKCKDQGAWSFIAIFQKRDIQTPPTLSAIFSQIAFFNRVLVDQACPEP